jgi:hypothetical protein
VIPSPVIGVAAVCLAACYMNQRLLGTAIQRRKYTKKIDAWNPGKRLRWKIYVIGIYESIFATFFLVAEENQIVREQLATGALKQDPVVEQASSNR